jgi:aryl-alcohol dehydrogenase-like predicted oxidoreductase
LPEYEREIVKRVEELARRKGWKMCQVALVWIFQKGAVPIVGISSTSRLDEACGIKGKSLTEDEMKWLEELYQAKYIIGHG